MELTALFYHVGYNRDGIRQYTAFRGERTYRIIKDGAGSLIWRVECRETNYDDTFSTLAEAKYAAEQNAAR